MEVKSVKANYVKIYWQYYRSLEKRFLKTEEFVAFDKVNGKVCGSGIIGTEQIKRPACCRSVNFAVYLIFFLQCFKTSVAVINKAVI